MELFVTKIGLVLKKSVDEDECRKKRKRCFTIDEHKKEEMLIKSREACANKSTHSGMCGRIQGLGVVMNKGSERNICGYCSLL